MAEKEVIEMVHVRTFLFNSLSGHSIQFEGPNKPVRVPPAAIEECMAIGAAPANEVNLPDIGAPKPNRLEREAAAPQGDERAALIKQGMRDMVGVNDPAAFDANGVPKTRFLNATLDFTARREEVMALWPEVKESLDK